MRSCVRLLTILVFVATFAGCATSGPRPAQEEELSVALLSPAQVIKEFPLVSRVSSPFEGLSPLHATNLPKMFQAVTVYLPKGTWKSIEVIEMALYSAKGDFIADATTKEELKKYWTAMGPSQGTLGPMIDSIDRYYLPPSPISGRNMMGHTYIAIFITNDPVLATDRVFATIKVDDVEKSFELDASSVIAPEKPQKPQKPSKPPAE
jgi:hypothetical protein